MAEYDTTTRDNKTIRVNRLVWEETNGKIPKNMIVHHKNGNKKDNRIENLELMSYSKHSLLHWAERRKRKLSA